MEPGVIRRKDRRISPEESREILERGEYGVMATVGSDGRPYAVPLSYVVMNDKLYFHCAHSGHKSDNLDHNPQVSFAVVGRSDAIYNGDYTVYYESAVVFGRAAKVLDDDEKFEAIYALTKKYMPNDLAGVEEYIKKHLKPTAVYAVTLDLVTGKANKEKC